MKLQVYLKAGSRWKIDDSTSILMWNNCWMKDNLTLFPLNDVASTIANLRVLDSMLPEFKAWNVPLLKFDF
jgi:hypothetical protein